MKPNHSFHHPVRWAKKRTPPWPVVLATLMLIFFICAPSLRTASVNHTAGRSQVGVRVQIQPSHPPRFLKGDKTAIYVMDHMGLGSQLINMLAVKIYYREKHGRELVADDSLYTYRLNSTTGILSGYFDTDFPVINSRDQYTEVKRELAARNASAVVGPFLAPVGKGDEQYQTYLQHREQVLDPQTPVIVVAGLKYIQLVRNRGVRKEYNPRAPEFYDMMVRCACQSLRFNRRTTRMMAEIREGARIPDFRSLAFGGTVAFHVRRGDKIKKESAKYPATMYVQKFLSVADSGNLVQHCFLATDDSEVVEEMQTALKTAKVPCRLHYLVQPNQRGSRRIGEKNHPETIQLLTEMSMLIDASYFVGTFRSNMGCLVSVLRGCVHKRHENFTQSYGVDAERWYFP